MSNERMICQARLGTHLRSSEPKQAPLLSLTKTKVGEADWQVGNVRRVAPRLAQREVLIERVSQAHAAVDAVGAHASDAGVADSTQWLAGSERHGSGSVDVSAESTLEMNVALEQKHFHIVPIPATTRGNGEIPMRDSAWQAASAQLRGAWTHGSAALFTSFHANIDCAAKTMTASTHTSVASGREVVGVESSRKTVVRSVLHARSTDSSGSGGSPLPEAERGR